MSSEIKLGSGRAGTSIPGSAPIVAGAFVPESLASPGPVSISGGRPKLPREDEVVARPRGDLLRGKSWSVQAGQAREESGLIRRKAMESNGVEHACSIGENPPPSLCPATTRLFHFLHAIAILSATPCPRPTCRGSPAGSSRAPQHAPHARETHAAESNRCRLATRRHTRNCALASTSPPAAAGDPNLI